MIPLAIPAIAAGIGVLGKLWSGFSQKNQANKIAKTNIRGEQTVQGEFQQNVNDAEQMARNGMPSQQYNNALNNIGRNQAGGLRLASRKGGTSGIASILRAGNDATANLDVQDSIQKNRNMLNLLQQRSVLGSQKQAAWNWNTRDKYLEKLSQEQALRGAGNQNLAGAFSDATQVGAMAIGAGGGGGAIQDPNFTPNSANLFGRLLGRNRSEYIGQRAGSVGVTNNFS